MSPSYKVDAESVTDTLEGSALFSARSQNGFGWSHQTHREFLAAWYLAHRDLELRVIESLYFQEQTLIAGPLREVAAWHATMASEVFELMLARDPDVLMKSDTASVSAPVRRALVNALLVRMDEFQAHDQHYGYTQYRRLAHPGLTDQLRPYMVAREKNGIVRRAAIDIAGGCEVVDLEPELIAIVRDASEPAQIRETAARALREFDTQKSRELFRDVLSGGVEPDTSDEILGNALRALWPDYIDAKTMFASLRAPRRPNFHGAYAGFLYELPDKLRREDVKPALEWVAKFDVSEYGETGRLRDHVVVMAIENVDDNEIASLLATVMVASHQRYYEYFGRRTRSDVEDEVRTKLTRERRRRLVQALLEIGAYSDTFC